MPNNNNLRLINDDSFINYCFGRNTEDMLHWENWLKENPDQLEEVKKIKKMVLLLGFEVTQKEVDQNFSLLKQKIAISENTDKGRIYSLYPTAVKIAVAATVLVFLSIGTYFVLQKEPAEQIAINQQHNIRAAKNQAILTLANGQKILIDKHLKGSTIKSGNAVVQINNDNTFSYFESNTGTSSKGQSRINTFSTARGEQSPFPLRLPDGTKVWLNAESSISFPTVFSEQERVVKITGEAYFDVAHLERYPFKVMVEGQIIEDIGTTFNINSYHDEPNLQTTLISGLIKVISPIGQSVLIKPGQMASSKRNSDLINVTEVNTEKAIAWKNGYFLFEKEPLESVMRKISRWYGVDIQYAKDEKIDEVFGGSISRSADLSEVLNILETTGDVRFKVVGKKITVSKK